MPSLFLLDNYDSFTYNLQHYFLQLGFRVEVRRNDETSVSWIQNLNPDAIVLSPGPGIPKDSGIMMELIEAFYKSKPILGICLGHQALGEFFGAELVHAQKPMHGKTSVIHYEEHPLFKNLPASFEVMRYHSLVLKKEKELAIRFIAHTPENEPMALVHESLSLAGMQFHPESILTPSGMELLKNWKEWLLL